MPLAINSTISRPCAHSVAHKLNRRSFNYHLFLIGISMWVLLVYLIIKFASEIFSFHL